MDASITENGNTEKTASNTVTFTTLPEKPLVIIEQSGSVTPFEATVEAQVNPENQPTTSCVFEYSQGVEAPKTAACEQPLGGSGLEIASAKLTGLLSGKIYSYHVIIKNATGKEEGAVETFTTLTAEKPAITGEALSGLTQTGVTVSAEVNPGYQETACSVVYWPTTGSELTGVTVPCTPTGVALGLGGGPVPISATLTPLAPRTAYDYVVIATNGTGESVGTQGEFTTLATPLLTVAPAEQITRTTATLSGTVNPGGVATTYHFVYVEAAHFFPGAGECAQGHPACAYEGEGSRSTQSEAVGSDYTAHAAGPAQITELKPGTAYDYALVATNAQGSTLAGNRTFTTSPPTPPSASTGEASGVTQLAATVSGTADTQGLPGTLSFQVALSPEGGSLESATVSGSQSGTSVSITFSFGPYLQPGTTYYYRAVATNADGTAAGEWRSFTTGTFLSPFPISTPFPLLSIPSEAKESPGKVTPPLTRAQKLAKALKACHKLKKSKRARCEKQARKTYAPGKKKK